MAAHTKALAQIELLRKHAHAVPSDIARALEYWHRLADIGGSDYRSGARLLDALRTPACTSAEGAYAFARAYMELVELSGDVPILDEPLRTALCSAVGVLPLNKAVLVERLITPNAMGHEYDA